jgi:hypothetical protein
MLKGAVTAVAGASLAGFPSAPQASGQSTASRPKVTSGPLTVSGILLETGSSNIGGPAFVLESDRATGYVPLYSSDFDSSLLGKHIEVTGTISAGSFPGLLFTPSGPSSVTPLVPVPPCNATLSDSGLTDAENEAITQLLMTTFEAELLNPDSLSSQVVAGQWASGLISSDYSNELSSIPVAYVQVPEAAVPMVCVSFGQLLDMTYSLPPPPGEQDTPAQKALKVVEAVILFAIGLLVPVILSRTLEQIAVEARAIAGNAGVLAAVANLTAAALAYAANMTHQNLTAFLRSLEALMRAIAPLLPGALLRVARTFRWWQYVGAVARAAGTIVVVATVLTEMGILAWHIYEALTNPGLGPESLVGAGSRAGGPLFPRRTGGPALPAGGPSF